MHRLVTEEPGIALFTHGTIMGSWLIALTYARGWRQPKIAEQFMNEKHRSWLTTHIQLTLERRTKEDWDGTGAVYSGRTKSRRISAWRISRGVRACSAA